MLHADDKMFHMKYWSYERFAVCDHSPRSTNVAEGGKRHVCRRGVIRRVDDRLEV